MFKMSLVIIFLLIVGLAFIALACQSYKAEPAIFRSYEPIAYFGIGMAIILLDNLIGILTLIIWLIN
ncbi:hypothetical protein [Cognaticolwellia mytili]|uniref:hypothetical protein n=1 Tax=Cognaticolwellia mytili TaxID=1888913 RepID=UPI000A16F51F|nr:hypothetical protein [Cognaticolwellia mytili]